MREKAVRTAGQDEPSRDRLVFRDVGDIVKIDELEANGGPEQEQGQGDEQGAPPGSGERQRTAKDSTGST